MADRAPGDVERASARVLHACACEGLRRTARALTQHYERALGPSGVRATQLPILVALAAKGPLPVTPLAEALVMDRTTLTRNLRILEKQALVAVGRGADRRMRVVYLTPKGRGILRQALGLWRRAQGSVEERFGPRRLEGLLAELASLTELVRG